MSNPFKVGDKITVTGTDIGTCVCAKDVTAHKAYSLTAVDTVYCNSKEPHDVVFMDDVGDEVILFPEAVTLVEE